MKTTMTDLVQLANRLRIEYKETIEQITSQAKQEQLRANAGRVNDHFAFNLGSKASELQGLAQRIALVDDLIAFNTEL